MEQNAGEFHLEREQDEFCVTLRFFGDDLVPEEISALLGYISTDSARKGDLVQLRTRSFMAPRGWWQFSSERCPEEIESQLIALFACLTSDLSVWQSLTTRFEADLFCGVFLARGGRGFHMSPRLHRLLAQRNLHIVFDIYVSDPRA